MKRLFYIACFTFLGLLLQLVLHALLEIGVISLLLRDFPRYSLGMSWDQWIIVHHVVTVILLIGGALWGYLSGVKFWNIIYVEKRYGWPPKWK